MTEKSNKKTYIKPTIEVVELRPEERIAGQGSNCGWSGALDKEVSGCSKGPGNS